MQVVMLAQMQRRGVDHTRSDDANLDMAWRESGDHPARSTTSKVIARSRRPRCQHHDASMTIARPTLAAKLHCGELLPSLMMLPGAYERKVSWVTTVEGQIYLILDQNQLQLILEI